jgi:hypothetical protein
MGDKPQGPAYQKYLEWVGEVRHFNNRMQREANELLKDPRWKLLGVFQASLVKPDDGQLADEYHYVLGRERE